MKSVYKISVSFFLLFLSATLLFLSKTFPEKLEEIYSTYINKYTVELMSNINSLFPFSLFEFLFVGLVIFFFYYCVHFISSLLRVINRKKAVVHFLSQILLVVSIFVFVFQLLWGLNYYRPSFETEVFLSENEYSTQELIDLYYYFAENVNKLRETVKENEHGVMKLNDMISNSLQRAEKGYIEISKTYTQLSGTYGSPKPLLLSKVLSYTGITGIYSPFTGEANINIDIPASSIPVTALHELAHQRGYASEDEANFIAFLTATVHPDTDYQYSGYLLALTYTGNELYTRDSEAYSLVQSLLSDAVMRDIEYKNEYWNEHEGIIEELSTEMNDTYLKANGVKEGVTSYSLVVNYLVGYYNHLRTH